VPILDLIAVANETGDKITLFGMNRSLTAGIPATIKLSGFSVHSATGMLLAADHSYVGHDNDRPEAVVPAEFKLAGNGSTFSHTFPEASVTRIELP
jgi:alpha-L-arabinofuranosidase